MKAILLNVMVIFTLHVKAQSALPYQNCVVEPQQSHYNPAPCSIAGQGTMTDLFLIQVGAYREQVNPKPGTIMIPTRTVDPYTGYEAFMYRYYVAAIFPSRLEAETFLTSQHIRGDFCDAIVVPFPFVGVVGYK